MKTLDSGFTTRFVAVVFSTPGFVRLGNLESAEGSLNAAALRGPTAADQW